MKPRNKGRPTALPDFKLPKVRIVVEVAGLTTKKYISKLAQKLLEYAERDVRVVVWWAGFREKLADAIRRLIALLTGSGSKD